MSGMPSVDELLALDDEAVERMGFEEAFAALEAVVGLLEDGELALDKAIVLYERGVALSGRCGAELEAAEVRVREVDASGGVGGDVDV